MATCYINVEYIPYLMVFLAVLLVNIPTLVESSNPSPVGIPSVRPARSAVPRQWCGCNGQYGGAPLNHWWLHTSTLWRMDISELDVALAVAEKKMWWGPCWWENLQIEHRKDKISWESAMVKNFWILKPQVFDKNPGFFQGTCLFIGFGFFW